jgi:hypothetical protein
MELTQRVRGRFHDLRRNMGAGPELELEILDSAQAALAEHGLNADEQLAARIRFAQFRCGILAIHHQDTTVAEAACLELIHGRAIGPVSAFMQARIGMVVLADRAVHDGQEFPRELFDRFLAEVLALPARADDEFWFFATLYAYLQRWPDVLAQADAHVIAHWEDASGIYLFKRIKLMHKLLTGTAKETDCGQVLQAINQPLFADEFNHHLLADCDGAGLMTSINRRIWVERQAEFGLRTI